MRAFCDPACPSCSIGWNRWPETRADRRTLLKWLLFAWMLYPARAWARTVALRPQSLPELDRAGGSVVVKVAGRKILLIRESAESVLAFSAVCTHKKTQLGYDPAARLIRCPKHESVFELTGRNVGGPAPRPLPKYPTRLLGDGRLVLQLDS
jgi:Rieske Fe-S protein